MDKCIACPALIMFARQNPTEKNPVPRRNPLDPIPAANGNLRVNTSTFTYDVLTGDDLQAAKDRGEELYISHFVTCPNKNQFRNKKRSTKGRSSAKGAYRR